MKSAEDYFTRAEAVEAWAMNAPAPLQSQMLAIAEQWRALGLQAEALASFEATLQRMEQAARRG